MRSSWISIHVKLAVYRHFAETGLKPTPEETAQRAGLHLAEVLKSYPRATGAPRAAARAGWADHPHGAALLRRAHPARGRRGQPAVLRQLRLGRPGCAGGAAPGGGGALRCEGSGEELHLKVGLDGPEPSQWVFHSLMPAAKWWDDIVFT